MSVFRDYIKKKLPYDIGINFILNHIRIVNRYDTDHLTENDFRVVVPNVSFFQTVRGTFSKTS